MLYVYDAGTKEMVAADIPTDITGMAVGDHLQVKWPVLDNMAVKEIILTGTVERFSQNLRGQHAYVRDLQFTLVPARYPVQFPTA